MRVAYLILAHEQPQLFGHLVRALHADDVQVFAYIDAKCERQPFSAASAATPVQFVPDTIRVYRAGFSQVIAMLKLLEYSMSAGEHDYTLFLSGRDFPLYSHAHLIAQLAKHPGRSYMNFYALVDGANFVDKVRRYSYYDLYGRLPGRALRGTASRLVRGLGRCLPHRKFFDGMLPYRGSTSWCLSKDVVRHIVEFSKDSRNRDYIEYFKSVQGCDEIFFQTIVLNSPHASTLNLYEIDGKRAPGDMKHENTASLHYINWSPQREDPAILDERDFDALYTSGRLFARKFDLVKSSRLLDMIMEVRRHI